MTLNRSKYSKHKAFLFLALLPGALSLFYLAASLLRILNESAASMLETLPFPVFTIFLTIVLIFIENRWSSPLVLRAKFAYTIPGFMAPTALFNAWTLAPSHLGGVAWGGIHYFLEAVARYPNVGSVNSEVLIGLLVMLCTCSLPVVIAWGYLSDWSKRTMYSLALFAVIGYLIVAVHLDFNLWLAGLYGTEQESLMFLLYGPVSRALAVTSTCYLAHQVDVRS
jgi:hypothetical protein